MIVELRQALCFVPGLPHAVAPPSQAMSTLAGAMGKQSESARFASQAQATAARPGPRVLSRALLTPQADPGSRYRLLQEHFKSGPWAKARRKGARYPRPVLGSWVGVRRIFHLSLFLTASRMVLPQDPSTDVSAPPTRSYPRAQAEAQPLFDEAQQNLESYGANFEAVSCRAKATLAHP